MNQYFLVATGIVVLRQPADNAAQALALVKDRIDARRNEHTNEEIGMSLVEALDARRLNFVVMDDERNALICGEYHGVFETPVSRELADSLRYSIPDCLYFLTEYRHD
jgi:hypothetical protein